VSTPTLPTDHEEYEALAVAWAFNALEPADLAVFEAHRHGCERCTRAAYAALEIAAELAYGVPDAAPPPRLREQVLSAAIQQRPNDQLTARPSRSEDVPTTRPASQGGTDRLDSRPAARPASRDETDGFEGRPAAPPASRDETDGFEGRPAAPPASRDETDGFEGRPAAPPASRDETEGFEGRSAASHLDDRTDGRVSRPTSSDYAVRSKSPPASASVANGGVDVQGRRPDGRAAGGDDARTGGPSVGRRASRDEAARRPKGSGPGRMARGLHGPRRLVYALAAAVLVAGSAITTWEVTRPAAVTDRIAAIIAGDGTVATVVAHQHSADVLTSALPPNSGRGTEYYLWGVPAEDGATPQIVGTFQVTTTGLHSYPLRLTRSLDGYPVLAVSEERAGSTPSAPSRVLGKGALGG